MVFGTSGVSIPQVTEYVVMEITPEKGSVIVLKIHMAENHVQGLIQMTGKNVMFNLIHVMYT